MTQAELKFLQLVPYYLHDIAESLEKLNKTLSKIAENGSKNQ